MEQDRHAIREEIETNPPFFGRQTDALGILACPLLRLFLLGQLRGRLVAASTADSAIASFGGVRIVIRLGNPTR